MRWFKAIFWCGLLLWGNAFSQYYGLSLKAGTLGAQAELSRSFGRHMSVRVGGAYLLYDLKDTQGNEDYTYTGNLKLSSGFVFFDWFPFGNAFRLSAGGVVNLNQGEVKLLPIQSYEVDGRTYTPEMLGFVKTRIDFNRFAPYVGIGVGNVATYKGFVANLDLGVMYQGRPRVEMKAEGLLEPSAEQDELVEENLSWFTIYPIFAIGLMYGF